MVGPASSFHSGEYRHMRRGLTKALLEAEAMEPRLQVAYSLGLVPAEVVAKMSLVRLLLDRAFRLTRLALDVALAEDGEYRDVYAGSRFSDRILAGGDGEDAGPFDVSDEDRRAGPVDVSDEDEDLQLRLLELGA